LHPNNLSDRSVATRAMGFAYYLQSDLDEAGRAYAEALSLAQAASDPINSTLASIRLDQIQEEKNQLHLAAETYQQVIQRIDDYSPTNASVAFLGFARVFYEWPDLNTAEQYGEQSYRLAQQYDQVVDRLILSEMFLARLKLARGDASGAAQVLSHSEKTARRRNYTFREPYLAYDQALVYLRQGNISAAHQLAQQHNLPLMRARLHIARDEPAEALAILDTLRQEAETNGWSFRLLMLMAVQSVALHANGDQEKALELLNELLARAEPEGFTRLFLDEGPRMAELLSAAGDQGIRPGYVNKLLAAFAAEAKGQQSPVQLPAKSSLVEPLSPREMEVLTSIAQGLSNQEIGKRLFLALDTVKGHNRRIFEKLQVRRRTEALARARELGLI
jgi:LuxR family transcriptional regulator, maltose regulon positive regulatory protein